MLVNHAIRKLLGRLKFACHLVSLNICFRKEKKWSLTLKNLWNTKYCNEIFFHPFGYANMCFISVCILLLYFVGNFNL